MDCGLIIVFGRVSSGCRVFLMPFLKVLVKQHSRDLELSCIFGNVRGNVWMGPLGMLRSSFHLPLCIPESKYFAASQNLLVWNTGQLKFFAYHTSASVGRGFFFPRPVHAVIWELFSCLGIQRPDKRCEGWGVASGEMPLGNMILLWVLRIYSSLGEQLVTEVTQPRECSWKIPVWSEIQAVTLWGFH